MNSEWNEVDSTEEKERLLKVHNNMIEICAMNSMDYVMCRGGGSLEEHDEQVITAR